MRHRLAGLTALSTLALLAAGPALAQDAPTPTPPSAPAPAEAAAAAAPSEEQLQAEAAEFQGRMEAMSAEIADAVAVAAGDVAKARTDTDPIVARYQPEADAFAERVVAFVMAQAALAGDDQAAAAAPMIRAQVAGIPSRVRDEALAPAAPAAPSPTQ